jgi:phosphoenolpyruvate carboxykinase (GTP)
VIDWIIRRISGDVPAVDSPIGRLPRIEDLNLEGLDIAEADLEELFSVDPEAWKTEADLTEKFYDTFGDRLPAALRTELASLRYRLQNA